MSQSNNSKDLPLWFTIPVRLFFWLFTLAATLCIRLIAIPYYIFGVSGPGSTLWMGGLLLVGLMYINANAFWTGVGLCALAFFWVVVGVIFEMFGEWAERNKNRFG